MDDDASSRSGLEKKLRELENRASDLSEDLEAERTAHRRTDKMKRELNDVSEVMFPDWLVTNHVTNNEL